MEIQGQAAIITGGASGLGAATAQALAQRGMKVYAFDLAASIEKASSSDNIEYLEVDVTDHESIRAGIATVKAGREPLRVVINCAGIGTPGRILSRRGPHDLNQFAQVINVNLLGTFNVMTLGAELIAQQEPLDDDGQRGIVINTASVAAFEGQIGQAAYAASKGGVHSLTISAARDLASYGIRVNTVAPGIVETPMMAGITPEFRESLEASVPFPARLARPEEYAQLVLDLIGHDYINGHTVRMDGALRMGPR
ncbi:SDR family NAD(P)-dependent oxidoreductase [Enteractinococcus helveticum]|uniref:3-hydroxy-2-methylbutyryl-CoA dehydrogenase n=1 Tax=Enteractinococcus helveticum TaxID=1837282 RepID=A0A1B7LYL8_9MICC|nr:SDR family NAD(P)-dependent oxidoreductase [Enteractinococcus helveticum]OAV60317.1 3-hydroxy-2-methylbutyryl-CoA dehydrogenase [Enteractinococcus helveticum]